VQGSHARHSRDDARRGDRAFRSTDVVKISASFPLAEAAKAHERIESSHVIGKIVLRVR
jgi:NADPH:quinone reductase-like Zn-dependent oxidoreductase